jgi:heat shock protein HslJ
MRLRRALAAALAAALMLALGVAPGGADADAAEGVLAARGNEPDWSARIAVDHIELVTELGTRRSVHRLPPAPRSPEGWQAEAEDGQIGIRVSPSLCRDSMSGMPYPLTVRIEHAGRTLQGCGGEPGSLLTGTVWRIEDVAGRGVIDAALSTLVFGDGAVSGRGGCNAFGGAMTMTGETLQFGPLAATRMACVAALMAQEGAVFAALSEVRRFDFAPDGALLLLGAADQVLLRARPTSR